MTRLFHITTREAWAEAQRVGAYRAPSLDTEGFLHLSTERQWLKTANRFFLGQLNLVLLELAPERLTAEVRFEPADGDEFPHLYGALPVAAVVATLELAPGADGRFAAPPERPPR